MNAITVRAAVPVDLDAVAQVEAACFPAVEAAGRKSLKEHLGVFPQSFSVAEDGNQVIGFISGAITNERTIGDKVFENTLLHEPGSAYQSIFGLDVIEEYRRQGITLCLMEAAIKQARNQGYRGLVLTCKDRLAGHYETFGYVNMGISKSAHSGAVWYDMILEFQKMETTLVAVGKIEEPYFEDAIREYAKCLGRYCKLDIIQVADKKTPNGAGETIVRQIKEKEGQCILSNIKNGAYVVALAIEGKILTSEGLAGRIQRLGMDGVGHIVLIIGGSLGLSGDVTKRANYAPSFSKMTSPYQLVRVVLLEQIYRSYRVISGEPYHKQRL